MNGLCDVRQHDAEPLTDRQTKKIRLNCWEFKQCGREPGGRNAAELQTCPASVEQRADGIHQGLNGGRCCWAVIQALRQKSVHEEQFGICCNCDFYRLVRAEETPRRFILRYVQPAFGGRRTTCTPESDRSVF